MLSLVGRGLAKSFRFSSTPSRSYSVAAWTPERFREEYEAELSAVANAPTVTAKTAAEGYRAGNAVLLHLSIPKFIKLQGVMNLEFDQVVKAVAELKKRAEAASAKDIYIFDAYGFKAGQAVYRLSQLEEFAGYNIKVVAGGAQAVIEELPEIYTAPGKLGAMWTKLAEQTEKQELPPSHARKVAESMGASFKNPQYYKMDNQRAVENMQLIDDVFDFEIDYAHFREWVADLKPSL